ncbi:alpha/beta hydrolase [Microbacterium sp. MYb62]|uniref:alpha/beta hydrolase n=1 Tax=Microbacterium sp. MYb62 TaxID=1848690 RepID=UPI000CFB02D5|nr:alpha/beta hydrolase [Microbacterium sp. MYb62]PRB09334.1 hypothetical protein CQ042_19540 [Microbacterium sp. MYb62]
MSNAPYQVADAQAMLAAPVPTPYSLFIDEDGPLLPTAGRAIFDYLRIAAGRRRASPAKVAVALAICDVWTRGGEEPWEWSPDADELITIGAATAGTGQTESDASEVVRLARSRIEVAIEGDGTWRQIWSAATAVGAQTGFSLERDAVRASVVWRALIAFAADPRPLAVPVAPDGASLMLDAVRSRVEATTAEQLSAINREWRPVALGSTEEASSLRRTVERLPPAAHERILNTQDPQRVNVWFGTNREPSARSNPLSGYTNSIARDDLFYGRCEVNVPEARDATGGLRRFVTGWLRRGSPDGRHPRVESRRRFDDEAAFIDDLEAELARSEPQERTALVFIHGYRTSFDRAAASTAQLAVNLKHQGPAAMFTWASRGSLLHYRHDERMIEASRAQLVRFLQTLTSIADLDHIDLVAHSLGNRLFLRSLTDWFTTNPPASAPLRNIFLGAPDIAQSEMLRSASIYARAATKTTMYGSDSDSALLASKLMNGEVRAGLMPPPMLTGGIDTIETSAVDASNLRHNGLVDARPVQSDMFLVQDGKLDPDVRPSLRRVNSRTLPYWRF